MTHSFSFRYHNREYCFIWDSESGSLHNVDRVTFLLAKERFGQKLTADERNQAEAIPSDVRSEILNELDTLTEQGVLNTPCTVHATRKQTQSVKALCLHICNDCNLRCKYCFADEGTYHTSDRAHMSAEVGKQAIDFLIANSGSRHNLEVDFFGGEPLMNLQAVQDIVAYARKREKESGKEFHFTMTTNCLLLRPETAEWLNREMHNVVLSIDGSKAVHNAMRPSANGKDVYDRIVANAQYFRSIRGDKSYYVRGTFTAKNLDFDKDVLALAQLGFDQISMEPVVTDIPDLAIKEEHLPQIFASYERLATMYLDMRRDPKTWFNFFHFMLDLEGGPCITKRLTGCGSGCEYLAVTPKGELYPCHQFAEKKEYCIGNVYEGILNQQVREPFARNVVINKADCTDCPAKYYCSGGCVANNLNFAGAMDKPYNISCRMMRKRFELSLAIAAIEGAPEQE